MASSAPSPHCAQKQENEVEGRKEVGEGFFIRLSRHFLLLLFRHHLCTKPSSYSSHTNRCHSWKGLGMDEIHSLSPPSVLPSLCSSAIHLLICLIKALLPLLLPPPPSYFCFFPPPFPPPRSFHLCTTTQGTIHSGCTEKAGERKKGNSLSVVS